MPTPSFRSSKIISLFTGQLVLINCWRRTFRDVGIIYIVSLAHPYNFVVTYTVDDFSALIVVDERSDGESSLWLRYCCEKANKMILGMALTFVVLDWLCNVG